MKDIRSIVRGAGAYLPARTMTNKDLTKIVDTDDEWIVQRTGIRERHIAAEGEYTSDIATAAARAAIENAGLTPADIDLIVLATATPDYTFPATAVTVQERLGIEQGTAFDLHAVCSGFVFAVTTADNYLRCGKFKRALVIGAETFSRILDWNDRTTCVLFGDGGGAIVLEAVDVAEAHGRGVLASRLRSDGRHRDKLFVDGGPSTTQTAGHLRMEGKEVFRHAVSLLSDVIEGTLDDAGVSADAVDWFVPHQANQRIISATAKKFGWPDEKVVSTVGQHGNTSAASIPLALDVAIRDGRIKQGDLVMIEALGGGFTWGAALIRW
ncbi:MAG: ketoacyl-ACP synthase III [Rhodobiaceae bacterium]|nr:ketoacyl-ACP synthase III [Rhodobiaceae bacterium]MCC0056420.1 ketoacyl-ACP synthase III [Rhodobiaceae bacterium]